MIKISLVIPSLQSGGMERVMSKLAHYFSTKKDVEIDLILYGKSRQIFFPIPENIRIHKPDFDFTDNSRIVSTFKTLFFLRKTVQKIDPDSVLSFGEYWNSFVLLSLLGLDFPVYVSDRCQPDKSLGKVHDQLRKWLYPKAAGIIAQTSIAKEFYQQQNLNKNIRVIGNPIHQISLNGDPQEKENIVLTVGRLIKLKHHDRLIKIFKKISSPRWKLVIVGGDALKQNGMRRLKKLVDELNMESSVEFTGTVSDIEKYYRKSNIFAFTSSSEGFPNVIGEAMSAGLPVIAYDCLAGPSDMINDGENGFLIPIFDDEEFSKKLKLLIERPSLRAKMSKKGQEKSCEYNLSQIGEDFYTFIID